MFHCAVTDQIPKCNVNYNLRCKYQERGKEDIFRSITREESKHDEINENGLTLRNFRVENNMKIKTFQKE